MAFAKIHEAVHVCSLVGGAEVRPAFRCAWKCRNALSKAALRWSAQHPPAAAEEGTRCWGERPEDGYLRSGSFRATAAVQRCLPLSTRDRGWCYYTIFQQKANLFHLSVGENANRFSVSVECGTPERWGFNVSFVWFLTCGIQAVIP